jgi:hypothetical protein
VPVGSRLMIAVVEFEEQGGRAAASTFGVAKWMQDSVSWCQKVAHGLGEAAGQGLVAAAEQVGDEVVLGGDAVAVGEAGQALGQEPSVVLGPDLGDEAHRVLFAVFTPRKAPPNTSASTISPRQHLHRRLGVRHFRGPGAVSGTRPAHGAGVLDRRGAASFWQPAPWTP